MHINFRKWLSYNPDTGVFIWLKTSGKGYRGLPAGTKTPKGYITIRVRGRMILAHRLAWWFQYGRFPKQYIDHINGIGTDNRILNLREASNAQNLANRGPQRNSSSGIKGVYWFAPQQCWKAQIVVNRQNIFLGYFNSKEEAAIARHDAEKKYHGEFQWQNRGAPTLAWAP